MRSTTGDWARPLAAVATTVVLHIGLYLGLGHAASLIKKPVTLMKFKVQKATPPAPPPTPEPPKLEPVKPPEPPKPEPVKPPPPPPKKKVASEPPKSPQRSVDPTPANPTPAAPQKVYTLPGNGPVAVNSNPNGADVGRLDGKPGGTGTGGKDATGTDPKAAGGGTSPKPVPLAALRSMPEPIGDYDTGRDYPDEARRLGIQGQVLVRVLVDDTGKVVEVKLSRGLGHGLDEKALDGAHKLRFKPARDESGAAVATWLTWTFTFVLPH